MIRLVDLEPRWLGVGTHAKSGITFLCPHCRSERLAIRFVPTIDQPDNEIPWLPGLEKYAWARVSGETFDDLSLFPSVDASKHGHWHGFITNGEVT